jgi:hypothetical protein
MSSDLNGRIDVASQYNEQQGPRDTSSHVLEHVLENAIFNKLLSAKQKN